MITTVPDPPAQPEEYVPLDDLANVESADDENEKQTTIYGGGFAEQNVTPDLWGANYGSGGAPL